MAAFLKGKGGGGGALILNPLIGSRSLAPAPHPYKCTVVAVRVAVRKNKFLTISAAYELSVPDVSRERRFLQTSPEQLMATKDKKGKKSEFPAPAGSGVSRAAGQKSGEKKTNKHKHFRRDGLRDKQEPSLGQMGPLPGTKWDPSLGQTGLSLFNSTVKSLFCPVCPWDGWGFVPGTIVPQGPSEKCLCVFCLLVFCSQKIQTL